MTINVPITPLANLSNPTTAVTNINSNFTAVQTGFSSALNTSGDQMLGILDMNNNQIINLPAPATLDSPARLVDISSTSGITVSVPATGTSGHVVGYLDGNLTYSGVDVFSNVVTFNSSVTANTISATTLTAIGVTASTLNASNSVGASVVTAVTAAMTTITGSSITMSTAAITTVTANTLNLNGSGSGVVTIGSSTGTYTFELPSSLGTSSQVLTSQGAGSSLTWTSQAAATTIALLNSITATTSVSALTDFTSITNSYTNYMFVISNITPSTSTTALRLQYVIGASTTATSTGYNAATLFQNTAATGGISSNGLVTSSILLTSGNGDFGSTAAGAGYSGTIYGMGLTGASSQKYTTHDGLYNTASTINLIKGGGQFTTASAITGIWVSTTAGNITGGNIRIYGIP